MSKGFTIAIDGPAAAGKGTVSKAVAAHFGFMHLDTGLLYRAVGAKVLLSARGIDDSFDQVLADVQARDKRDRERVEAPLRPADDAVTIDTSDLSIEQAVSQATAVVQAAR